MLTLPPRQLLLRSPSRQHQRLSLVAFVAVAAPVSGHDDTKLVSRSRRGSSSGTVQFRVRDGAASPFRRVLVQYPRAKGLTIAAVREAVLAKFGVLRSSPCCQVADLCAVRSCSWAQSARRTRGKWRRWCGSTSAWSSLTIKSLPFSFSE